MNILDLIKPDSVFATQRVSEGDLEAVPLMLWNIVKRGVFLSAGIALAGVRGKQLVLASLYGSGVLSGLLIAYFKVNPDYTTDVCVEG